MVTALDCGNDPSKLRMSVIAQIDSFLINLEKNKEAGIIKVAMQFFSVGDSNPKDICFSLSFLLIFFCA